jgi:carbon storage regulator
LLVITRKKGESLVIGENIHITIEDIQKGQVKLSIEAPREVAIVREEIIQEITIENKAANVEVNNAQALSKMVNQLKKGYKKNP